MEIVVDIAGRSEVSQAALYTWKKQYAGMGVQELRQTAGTKRPTESRLS